MNEELLKEKLETHEKRINNHADRWTNWKFMRRREMLRLTTYVISWKSRRGAYMD